MHSVAPKVAQEIGVPLQHRDLDPGPGHQQPKDHPSGATANDEACRTNPTRHAVKYIPASSR
jgi:hypothetical protein